MLTIVVAGSLGYSTYKLLQVSPQDGQNLLQTLLNTNEREVMVYLITAGISFLVLLILVFNQTRIITEEMRLKRVHESVMANLQFVSRVEGRHEIASQLKGSLVNLSERLGRMTHLQSGLPALLQEVEMLTEQMKDKIKPVATTKDGQDIVLLVSDADMEVKSVVKQVGEIEEAFARVPQLLTSTQGYAARATALQEGEEGLFAQMDSLRELLDDLLDDSTGKLQDLEAGDPSETGDLDDQIANVESDFDDLKTRMEGLEKLMKRFDAIKNNFAALAAKQRTTLQAAE